MKKRIWLCIALLTFLLAACTKKTEPSLRTSSSDTAQITPDSTQACELPPSDSEISPSSKMTAASEESGKLYDVESAVSAAILNENRNRYLAGECMGEGHTILSTEEEEGQINVYLLAMFGWYQFQDCNFVKNSGSGVIPTVIVPECLFLYRRFCGHTKSIGDSSVGIWGHSIKLSGSASPLRQYCNIYAPLKQSAPALTPGHFIKTVERLYQEGVL